MSPKTKYPDALKCAAIFASSKVYTTGSLGVAGVSLSSGGIGLGGFAGGLSTTSNSELSQMFEPLVLNPPEKDTLISNIVFLLAVIMFIIALVTYRFFGETACYFVGLVLGILSMTFIDKLAKSRSELNKSLNQKYNDDKERLERTYQSIYYSPKEHVVFVDENFTLPATRENFVKLLMDQK